MSGSWPLFQSLHQLLARNHWKQDAVRLGFDPEEYVWSSFVELGREIDLIEKSVIENSHNPIRRRNILDTAQVIYTAAYEHA